MVKLLYYHAKNMDTNYYIKSNKMYVVHHFNHN